MAAHARSGCRETFWDCPVDDTRRILGLNAPEFYGFDVDKLAPLVERIGPTPDEFGQTADVDMTKWDALERRGPALAHGEGSHPGAHTSERRA